MSTATTPVRQITIDPITRLEGHRKIDIFLDDAGKVERAYFQVPELRGFEKFAEGRPVEEMPQITSRICGVCPTAHHMAATKAVDAVYQVEPTPAARKIREMVYMAFLAEDHALHFYVLGGPDFVVGPTAPAAERNILGVIGKVGVDTGKKVIAMRRKLRAMVALAAGKAGHPVFGLPGGVARRFTEEERGQFRQVAAEAVEFAQFSLGVFDSLVLKNSAYVDLILSDPYTHRTHYMGLVDRNNKVNFYDGQLRVVSPEGNEVARFDPARYFDYIGEHVEPWSYMKFCYLKQPAGRDSPKGPPAGFTAWLPWPV
jgi:F420-non-reducing hydrogenase large subunit